MLEATALPRVAPISCVSLSALFTSFSGKTLYITMWKSRSWITSLLYPQNMVQQKYRRKNLGLETVAGQGESIQRATTREIWVHVEANKNSSRVYDNNKITISILSPLLAALVVILSEPTYSPALTLDQAFCPVDERCKGGENTIFGGNWNGQESTWSASHHDTLGCPRDPFSCCS